MLKFFLFFFFSSNLIASEVNLFTSRHYESDSKVFKKFTEITGIKLI